MSHFERSLVHRSHQSCNGTTVLPPTSRGTSIQTKISCHPVIETPFDGRPGSSSSAALRARDLNSRAPSISGLRRSCDLPRPTRSRRAPPWSIKFKVRLLVNDQNRGPLHVRHSPSSPLHERVRAIAREGERGRESGRASQECSEATISSVSASLERVFEVHQPRSVASCLPTALSRFVLPHRTRSARCRQYHSRLVWPSSM